MESYTGAVQTSYDAIILLEAARVGMLPTIRRRLKDKERQVIKAGDVFIWDEKEAKMRRWTDGRSWSASRVTGSFLTYREMESQASNENLTSDDRFNLSNFRYKQNGLIKQSFSITTKKGAKLHLISYTTTKDFTSSKLLNKTPSKDPAFANLVIPKDLYPITSHTLEVLNSKSTSPSSRSTSKSSSPRLLSSHPSPLPDSPSDGDESHLTSLDMITSSSITHQSSNTKLPQPSLLDATPRVVVTQPSPKLTIGTIGTINNVSERPMSPSSIYLPPLNNGLCLSTETPIFPKTNHRSNNAVHYDAATLSALDRMTFNF